MDFEMLCEQGNGLKFSSKALQGQPCKIIVLKYAYHFLPITIKTINVYINMSLLNINTE